MVQRRLTIMIAVTTVLIFVMVLWDWFRPSARDRATPHPVAAGETSHAVRPAVPVATTSTSQGASVPVEPEPEPVEREPTYLELLARSETRRRIRASGSSTYLGDMVAAAGDSTLRRWDNRTRVPIRVWFTSSSVTNFQPAFVDAVRDAFQRWANAGVPVRFDFDADSASAEVTVRWRVQFEIERTGQTDVTWDQNGAIQSAVVTIATFDPKGRPLDVGDVRVVAMHEAGHLLGLDHSTDSTDIMFPTAKVRDLSPRDIRTAVLLYQLIPGSLR
jgi:hypothetical protein